MLPLKQSKQRWGLRVSDDDMDIIQLIKKLGKSPDDYESALDDFQILKTIVETVKTNPKKIGMAVLRAYELGKVELFKEKS